MKIEHVPVEEIKESPRNPRVIPERAVVELSKSIEQHGFLSVGVLDENNELLAGHTRLRAVKMLGRPTMPCIRKKGLSPAQKDAFRLADNKLSELTTWDDSSLLGLLHGLEDLPPGFTDDDLSDLEAILGENDDDGDPEPVGEPSGEGSGGSSVNSSSDLVPVVVRCRRDVAEEAKKLCQQIVESLEAGS